MSNSTVTLITGSNSPINKIAVVDIIVQWSQSPSDLDVSCFMVNTKGKVPSDDYFIFYNQAADPKHIVKFEPLDAKSVKFTIKLEALLSGEIEKCVFAATLDGPGTFADVQGCRITVRMNDAEIVYEIKDGKAETSLVLAELYRHQGWFKLRSIGRGFNGGLKPLAEAHGVNVDEEQEEGSTTDPTATAVGQAKSAVKPQQPVEAISAVAQTAASQATQQAPLQFSPISTSLPVNLSKIDLLKAKVKISLAKKNIELGKARVAVVFDASGSMSSLYSKGTVQRAFEKTLAVAACMDDDGLMDVWFFGSKSKRFPSVTESEYENYVRNNYPAPKIFGGLGIGNNEPVVMEDVIKKYTKEEPNDQIPTYIIFFSDGGIYETAKISKLLKESSNKPIFWQFVGLGDANFGVLEELDDLQGRYVDNADFFALSDLDTVSDEDLYDRLFNEFPGWIMQVKEKGIISG
ncbi:tellurium resistance protein TerF [Paenibacillus chitinolyticus]|uniref:vWA domain-containing protein n=1 Tax=Paenibacillus chitinolyticus TaxID=79263 RepID=UPI0026E4A020|nr:VWA domain-containing protein [Paenibacillus chitinolyticus]GKS15087.1 tellurium resistance protein TerF [Paenibacillus chitinolyticus]